MTLNNATDVWTAQPHALKAHMQAGNHPSTGDPHVRMRARARLIHSSEGSKLILITQRRPDAARRKHYEADAAAGTTGEGVANSDLVLMLSAKAVAPCNAQEFPPAFATYCALDATSGRPLVAMVNW